MVSVGPVAVHVAQGCPWDPWLLVGPPVADSMAPGCWRAWCARHRGCMWGLRSSAGPWWLLWPEARGQPLQSAVLTRSCPEHSRDLSVVL